MLPIATAALFVSAGCGPAAPAAGPTAAPTVASKPTSAPVSTSPGPAGSPAASPAAKPAASPSALPAASLVPSPSAIAGGAPAAAGSLKGVCPDNIVFQTNWWPEPDHGFLYQLIGPNGTIDTNKDADDSIFLAMVATDEQVGNSANQPTKAVFAWYDKNPQIFMWGNPDWNFQSVADIGKSGQTVLAFSGAAYLDVLQGKNLLDKKQVDTSYAGDPSRFVAADGNLISQGFVTAEPYIYEHEVQGWMKPVKFLLLDKDVPIYQDTMAIRTDKLDASRACLQKLVPLMQRSAIDYVRNPGPINAMIVDYTSKIKGGTQVSAAGATDTARVQAQIDDYGPVFTARGKAPQPGLKPSDLITNEFLDPSIKL
jgi:hypothetical protein